MRRTYLTAAAFAIVSALSAAPAYAGYGALARDEGSGKFGLSWDKPTQQQADDAAMKDCTASSCKIVFRTKPGQCGAIATPDTGTAWGASDRGNRRDTVELAAMKTCQQHTAGQCKVRASGCNK
jgi:hypothetical protein